MIRRLLCRLGFREKMKRLIERRNLLMIRNGMNLCLHPKYEDSLEYTATELNIKVLDLEIELIKAFCNKIFEGEDV